MDVHSVLRFNIFIFKTLECDIQVAKRTNFNKEICNSRKKIETKWNIVETVAGRKPVNNDNHLFSLLHRAYCRVIQLLYQLMHIYKIYTLKY